MQGGSRAPHRVDTSGFSERCSDQYLIVDLFLLDIKSGDPETYQEGDQPRAETDVRFARRLSERGGKPMWVRFVLVPGLTDDPA